MLAEFGSRDFSRQLVANLVKKAEPSICAVAFHPPHLASSDSRSTNGYADTDGFQANGQHELSREPKLCLG